MLDREIDELCHDTPACYNCHTLYETAMGL